MRGQLDVAKISRMHISELHIKNFKRFHKQFSLQLKPGLNILVGDNEVGKSTILESIHLVLTGYLGGRLLRLDLSQSLFNKESVEEYLESFAPGNTPVPLPEILIEVHLVGDDLAILEGDGNDLRKKCAGLSLRISFAEKYQAEYELLLNVSGGIKSLPIEFYEVTWKSFARQEITARTIPFKSALIDSSAARYANGGDLYVSRIVKDLLDIDDIVRLTQAHRSMRDAFVAEQVVADVNKKIQLSAALTKKNVHLSAESSSSTSWENVLVTHVDGIPFQQIGRGEQSVVKTRLALGHKKSKEANVLLIEEPENHLSHSKLNELVAAIQSDGGARQIVISTHSSFVANKLGLQHLVLLGKTGAMRLDALAEKTQRYFQKLPGFDTLRLVLCRKAILVEGPSDELVVQRAYQDAHDRRLPIQDGIDVISVGTAFRRFLEVAKELGVPVTVVTDNDGNVEGLQRKYSDFIGLESNGIQICFDAVEDPNMTATSGKPLNGNTLESKIQKVNERASLNDVLGTAHASDAELLEYMIKNKTECALAIFDSSKNVTFPQYIKDAVA
jgi:putative ATP-dependent endonuclease of OLD family